jgi:Tfp pilus assembly PilM family ATPase
MVMKHAGLDISDDMIRFIIYSGSGPRRRIDRYDSVEIPDGIVQGGDIKDERSLGALLAKFDKDNDLTYVKVSVPEEKAYLFQTEVPDGSMVTIAQNIEFKLEENVPLSVADAVFYFDILPGLAESGALRASVSVVPRVYIENLVLLLREVGIYPMAFEVVPKSIAKAVIPPHSGGASLIVHIMKKKTGIYVVLEGIVCFTSTIAWGSEMSESDPESSSLTKEINRVYSYWLSHNVAESPISSVILIGRGALVSENNIKRAVIDSGLTVSVANVWNNIFSLDKYVPTISRDDSLEYGVAAGLALDL